MATTRLMSSINDTSNDEARAIYEKMMAELQAAGVTLTLIPHDGDDDDNDG